MHGQWPEPGKAAKRLLDCGESIRTVRKQRTKTCSITGPLVLRASTAMAMVAAIIGSRSDKA